jgi:hypothetical protein
VGPTEIKCVNRDHTTGHIPSTKIQDSCASWPRSNYYQPRKSEVCKAILAHALVWALRELCVSGSCAAFSLRSALVSGLPVRARVWIGYASVISLTATATIA